MSRIVSERQAKLITHLLLGRVSDERFLTEYPLSSKHDAHNAAAKLLADGAVAEDALAVESALNLGHRFGFSVESTAVLCDLATADWHKLHEAVLDGLDCLRSPASVDAVYALALAQHEYRAYDEVDSMAVKATWVLRKIGGADAREKLEALSKNQRPILSREAAARLEAMKT